MAPWHFLLGLSLLIGAAIAIEAVLKRNRPRRPLAERMHDPEGVDDAPQLGMEATDLAVMEDALRANRHVRMTNDGQTGSKNPFATFRARRPKPLPDDETYSKIYYHAFRKSGRGEKK